MNVPLKEAFIIQKEVPCPFQDGNFRLLSNFDGKSFLVLQTLKREQNILKYNVKDKNITKLKSFPRHPFIVSATISKAQDFLIVIFYSINNGFNEKKCYYAMCYHLLSDYFYPIFSVSNICPKIDFGETSNKLYILNGESLETWDMQKTQDDFILSKTTKSSTNVLWWGLRNKKFFEFVYCDIKENKKHILFICPGQSASQASVFQFPNLKKDPFTYLHLKGYEEQNIIMSIDGKDLVCYFLRGCLKLVLPYQLKDNEEEFKRSLTDQEIWNCQLENDILFIKTNMNNIVCILVDQYAIPRSIFNIALSDTSEYNYIKGMSESTLSGLNTQDGSFVSVDFDYKKIIEERPDLLQIVLHYSTIKYGVNNPIFQYITMESLQYHWANPVFDEYFICLMNRNDCSTFCSLDSSTMALFDSIDDHGIDHVTPTSYHNFGQLFKAQRYPSGLLLQSTYKNYHLTQNQNSSQQQKPEFFQESNENSQGNAFSMQNNLELYKVPIRTLPPNLLFFGLIQYYVDLLWNGPNPEIPADFVKHVYPKLDFYVALTWYYKGLAPFQVLTINHDELSIEHKWWAKRKKKKQHVTMSQGMEVMSLEEHVKAIASNNGNEPMDEFIVNMYKDVLSTL